MGLIKNKRVAYVKRATDYIQIALIKMFMSISAPRFPPFRFRRMIGGTLAPVVPWQAMVHLSDNILNGGYAGGALISDRWVLTAGRNLFVRKTRQDTQGKDPMVPKVYLGISALTEAVPSRALAVEKVSKNAYRTFGSLLSKFF